MERMCGMPILKKSSYTIKDIYALPEGERAELIDGRICDGTTEQASPEVSYGVIPCDQKLY